jgi:hypothetical protein
VRVRPFASLARLGYLQRVIHFDLELLVFLQSRIASSISATTLFEPPTGDSCCRVTRSDEQLQRLTWKIFLSGADLSP